MLSALRVGRWVAETAVEDDAVRPWHTPPASRASLSMFSDGPVENAAEHRLVRLAAAGDERAFREIVRTYQATVAGVVTAMLGPGDDADDVGQETFIKLVRAMPSFRGDASLRTFITRIAMNASLDMLARRKRELRFVRLGSDDDPVSASLADDSVAGDTEQEHAERARQVQQAIDSLDGKHRAVVVLRVLEERSTNEAAQILGVPPGTVMSRLTRALRKLDVLLRPVIDR